MRKLWIDLLEPEQENYYLRSPGRLADQIEHGGANLQRAIIDEIQDIPSRLGQCVS